MEITTLASIDKKLDLLSAEVHSIGRIVNRMNDEDIGTGEVLGGRAKLTILWDAHVARGKHFVAIWTGIILLAAKEGWNYFKGN